MGCCLAVPPDENYVGIWQSNEGVEVKINDSGNFKWKGGNSDTKGLIYSVKEVDRNTEKFVVGGFCCCCATEEFVVQKKPVQESGNWKHQASTKQYYSETKWRMIMNKERLYRNID
eukprot:TRINITY_DN1262_c0_g1_i2.p1 TRINITY_DN1262_c0_g1~~TRINITY_DN1262_c0_g1_i2.p1  ORF type:complete len:116 (-),score=36.99 TRINITY_DN1262_c0_g1_i2:204-551(-)